MSAKCMIASIALIAGCALAAAQQPSQLKLTIDSTHRTITVSADGRVSVDPDVAILHVGFETKPTDAKSAYADGARISNAIVDAIKQAGIPETSIRSEFQRLEPVDPKNHKFKLTQNWTVKTPPARAGEILDVAVNAGLPTAAKWSGPFRTFMPLKIRLLNRPRPAPATTQPSWRKPAVLTSATFFT